MDDVAAARAEADRIGYPVIIKAAAGGGGKGMRLVADPDGVPAACAAAAREADVPGAVLLGQRQLDFLRSCNCDLAQGYLISRPIQPEKVSAILRSEIAGTRLLARGMP